MIPTSGNVPEVKHLLFALENLSIVYFVWGIWFLTNCRNIRITSEYLKAKLSQMFREAQTGKGWITDSTVLTSCPDHKHSHTQTHEHARTNIPTRLFFSRCCKVKRFDYFHWPPVIHGRTCWSPIHKSDTHAQIYTTFPTICLIATFPVPSQAFYLIASLSSCNLCYLTHTHPTLCATLSLHIAPCQPLCCMI